MDGSSPHVSEPFSIVSGCRILAPHYNPTHQMDIHLSQDGHISSINPHSFKATAPNMLDATNYLIAPSLCHAHIHLDKCFLLSEPKFADLKIVKGDFTEAVELTSKAKERFERQDLMRRGKWLLAESIAAGVTHMRAFVEVDHVVGLKCLKAAVELKRLFSNACQIQICAFAQDPIYSEPYGEENRRLMEEAVSTADVEVVGSTPYVEDGEQHMRMNIEWAAQNALHWKKHLDLHLDYNLDRDKEPLSQYVVKLLKDIQWPGKDDETPQKTISLGHCTRLTLFSREELKTLSQNIGDLPLHFVGLPTSDLFIQGKPLSNSGGGERPCGTLQIPQLVRQYGIPGCIAINNVGNAFTPYGSCDPLSIASIGVGIYHAGTKDDTQLLYECVSSRAKEAIGFPEQHLEVGGEANFVLFEMGGGKVLSRQRGRKTLQEVVYDPPRERKTIFRGMLVEV